MLRNSNENVTVESLRNETIHDEIPTVEEYFLNMNATITILYEPIESYNLYYKMPTVEEYFLNLNTFATLSIIIASLMFIFNISVYFFTYKQIQKRVRKQFYNHTLILNGLYSIISLAALIAILVPKLVIICHTIMHLTFAFGAIVYYKLCYLYIDGEDNFLKEENSKLLSIRTGPCCCWCTCLHPLAPTKKRLNIISYMVYQLPCIQFVVMLILDVLYVYKVPIFKGCYRCLAPFMFTSILIGIWGLNIVKRMVAHVKEHHNMKKKFICLLLILIFCKFQYIILNLSLESVDFGGVYPISNTVYKQNIINLAILLEMFPLSLLAKHAYKLPTHL